MLDTSVSWPNKLCLWGSDVLRTSYSTSLTDILSVIRTHNLLWTLITGKTSSIATALPCWFRLAYDFAHARSIWKRFRFIFLIWRPPALPHRLQCSTIGRLGLNRRVRDGYGCFPQTHRHQKSSAIQLPRVQVFPHFESVSRLLSGVNPSYTSASTHVHPENFVLPLPIRTSICALAPW